MAYGPDTAELLRRIRTIGNRDTLMLNGLNITSFPELPNKVKTVYCSCSQVSRFPEFSYNLRHLFCFNTQLTEISELPLKLQTFMCGSRFITSLPPLPDTLVALYVTAPLKSLPELPNGLKTLKCVNTKLSTLPTLPDSLQCLNCTNSQITELPELPAGLVELICYNVPLILKRRDNESIADYNLRWREWKKQRAEEQASKQRIQERHKLLKEEIVAAAWHPRRVERWLDQGIEIEAL
jgi:hypothetical protein